MDPSCESRFQPLPSFQSDILTDQASLMVTIENDVGKVTPKGSSPCHPSIQNFTLRPFPTRITTLVLKPTHRLIIAFHTPISYPSLTPLEHQPPSSQNYPLPKGMALTSKSPYHLLSSALLRMDNLLLPKTPLLLSIQIKD